MRPIVIALAVVVPLSTAGKAVAAQRLVDARSAMVVRAYTPAATMTLSLAARTEPDEPPRRLWPYTAAGGVLVGLAVVGGVYASNCRHQDCEDVGGYGAYFATAVGLGGGLVGGLVGAVVDHVRVGNYARARTPVTEGAASAP